MGFVRALHRWAGGLVGLLLALLGATGTLLLYRNTWLRWTLPHAADPLRADGGTAAVVGRLLGSPGPRPSAIVLASDDVSVHRLIFGASPIGAYADQGGTVVARWSSEWQRPELLVFDLHHHLLAGDTGDAIVGTAGLLGLLFVVTGALLWWRTRRTFAPRLLPARLTRPAVVRHHRDLGILVALPLLVMFTTGAMMALRPVEALVLRPFGPPGALARWRAPPPAAFGRLPARPDWPAMMAQVAQAVPGAAIRVITLPARPGMPIVLRLRTVGDWTPNGSTIVWIDPATGKIAAIRDPAGGGTAVRLAGMEYPLHAARIGWGVWKAVLTLCGLGLTLLGTLAVMTFWTRR